MTYKLSAEGNQKSVYLEFSSSVKSLKIISDHTVIGTVLKNPLWTALK